MLRYETQQALSAAIHSHGKQLQLGSAGSGSMQMFILLLPLFSIVLPGAVHRHDVWDSRTAPDS